ncbi:hypothetical protein ACQ9BO_13425 [Flavobacterium sp. P21]|uniref:hypothetical protein n=1 Tax=Flavobacterium sp. P21 TaxID=3423948 RepID=UPI003D668E2B
MSTNHNRIKVSDLETNEPDKILSTNSFGELEFMNVNNLKTENYNALDCTEQGKALDARQGKVLKDLIDNKVDKVSGERLITIAEQIKLAEIQVGAQNLLEEKIYGTVMENLSMAGSVNIDFNSFAHGKFTLTGNTIWTFTNMPAVGRSITRTYEVNSLTTQSLSITNTIKNFGSYLADSSINFITIVASNTTYSGLKINVFFNN